MLDFYSPKLEDRVWSNEILKNCGYYGADCCFGTLFIWSEVYKTKICRYKDFLLRLYEGDEIYYGFPLGKGDIAEVLSLIIDDAKERNVSFKLLGFTENMKEFLDVVLPHRFDYKLERNIFDYIYDVSALSKLEGKKYHSKRNHISKFKKLYDWTYENIDNVNLNECKSFIDKWFRDNMTLKGNDIQKEYYAILKSLNHFNDLGLLGGLIRVDSKIVALTIGEEINEDVFLIHFEKADYSYSGSYTVINKEFAQRNLKNYKYINREEDMGIEGLRKSKLSYYPVELLNKYEAILKV